MWRAWDDELPLRLRVCCARVGSNPASSSASMTRGRDELIVAAGASHIGCFRECRGN